MLTVFRWTALIAAVVFLIAFAGVVLSPKKSAEPGHQQATEESEKGHKAEKSGNSLFDTWFPDTNVIFNLFLAFFTGLLAFGGLYQLNFLTRAELISAKTAQAAKDSADAAIAAQRPWLTFEIDTIEWLGKSHQLRVRFTIKNVGHTPALNVRIVPYIEIDKINNDGLKYQALFDRTMKFAAASAEHTSGETLFPAETLAPQTTYALGINEAELKNAISQFRGLDGVSLYLVAAVTYQFGSGTGQTVMALEIHTRDQLGMLLNINPAIDVPAAGPWALRKLPIGKNTF